MVLLVIAMSGISYGVARVYRYYTKMQQRSLLDAPIDLLEDFKKEKPEEDDGGEELLQNRQRFSKAQARQRFRKGKS